MSFDTIEYGEAELTHGEEPPPRVPRPWTWAVAGLLLGTVIGYVSVTDLDSVATTATSLPPLTLPAALAGDADEGVVSAVPRDNIPGFDQTLWLLVDAESPRLLRWSPHESGPSDDVVPLATANARPDISGAVFAEEIPTAEGTLLTVTFSTADVSADRTVAVGFDVTGWAWHTSVARTIAWSEPVGNDTAIRWTSFGPRIGEVILPGTWTVVAYDDRIVARRDRALMLIDPNGDEPLVERGVTTGPIVVQGVFDGLVYAIEAIPDADPVQFAVELDLGNRDRVDWRHPAALRVVEAPGTGWGALWFGRSVSVHGPEGFVRTFIATAEPYWDASGRFLIFPDSTEIVVFDTATQTSARLPTAWTIISVWGS